LFPPPQSAHWCANQGYSDDALTSKAGKVLSAQDLQRIVQTAALGPLGERNLALVLVLLTTGAGLPTLLGLNVRDYLQTNGERRDGAEVTEGEGRRSHHIRWANERACQAIDNYLAKRSAGNGGTHRGLDPCEALFVTDETERLDRTGSIRLSSKSLSRTLCQIFERAGVTTSPVRSARMTLVHHLQAAGASDADVQRIAGVRTKYLLRRVRPERTAPIVSAAIANLL